MRKTFLYQKHFRASVYLILFFIGIFIGIVVVQMTDDTAYTGIFSEYFLNQYALLKIDYGKLLKNVGRYRIGQYALLVCCCAFSNASSILGVFLFVLGMSWGTMMSVSTLRLGMHGVMLCVVGVLPQIFFYIPAFGWVLFWVIHEGFNRKKYFFLCAVGFFFLLFGIIAEVYLNPVILKQVLRGMS